MHMLRIAHGDLFQVFRPLGDCPLWTFFTSDIANLCLTRHLSTGSVKPAELWPSTPGAELAMGFWSVDKPEPPLPGKLTPLHFDHQGGLMEQSNASLQRGRQG